MSPRPPSPQRPSAVAMYQAQAPGSWGPKEQQKEESREDTRAQRGSIQAGGTRPASTQPLLERCLLNFKELEARDSQGQPQAFISSRSFQATGCDSPIMDVIISPTPLLTPGARTGSGILLQPAACPGGQATPSTPSQAKDHK